MNPKTEAFIRDLRAIADWYEEHPDMAIPEQDLAVYSFDRKEEIELVERVGKALRTFKKEYAGATFTISKKFGNIRLRFVFMRDAVCTPRVVETIEEEVEVIDYDNAPKIKKIVKRDVVEWDCPPALLSGDEAA